MFYCALHTGTAFAVMRYEGIGGAKRRVTQCSYYWWQQFWQLAGFSPWAGPGQPFWGAGFLSWPSWSFSSKRRSP
jgi:hypothetical protein